MIESIRHIRNPLTIVAIFAALAELAGTVSPTTLDKSYHGEIVLFLIFFPTLLVALFFLTLWFRPWVLYAPSDFQNEECFLEMFKEAQRASVALDEITAQFQNLIKKAVGEVVSSGVAPKETSGRVAEVLGTESAQIMSRIGSVKTSLEEYATSVLPRTVPLSRLQSDILQELRRDLRPLAFSEICRRVSGRFKRNEEEIKKALGRMVQRSLLKVSGPSGNASYSLDI